MIKHLLFVFCCLSSLSAIGQSEIKKAPVVKEGDGPYSQLIIRGVMLIDGTGAPPIGPTDIVVKQNRIVQIQTVGYPGVEVSPERRPKLEAGGRELNAEGMYLMPGFIDMHGHIGGGQAPIAEYVFKLWMGHGVTTVRDPSAGNGLDWVLEEKANSAKNAITAPRIFAYTSFGQGSKEPIATADQAVAWVVNNNNKGADGIKFFGASPDDCRTSRPLGPEGRRRARRRPSRTSREGARGTG
jgi:hypothetical protein